LNLAILDTVLMSGSVFKASSLWWQLTVTQWLFD